MHANSTTVLKEQSLELWHKLFQVSLWDDIKKAAQGENPEAPLIVEIDPTSFCDLACPECNSIEVLRQKSFSSERLLDLAQECVDMGVRGVILSGGGEPLIHPATPELIRLLSLGGVQVGLVTNGTQLGRYSEIISQHCSWIRISMDAGSEEVYRRFRPARREESPFSRIIKNIKTVASDFTRRTRVGYSFLTLIRLDDQGELIDSNLDDIAKAAVLARDLSCDYFELKYSYQWRFRNPPQEFLQRFADQVDAIAPLENERFKVLLNKTAKKLLDGSGYYEQKNYSICNMCRMRAVIGSNGAFHCPYFRGRQDKSYGDPQSQSLQELWNSARRQELLDQTNPSLECGFACARHEGNLALNSIAAGEADFDSWLVEDYDPFI